MTNIIQNPILKGFNPDPSIVRVGDDYFIATSTFEWYPGVQIHHSKDLKHWKLIGHPLKRLSQLDLRGVPDSCGVWAPCLSYHEGTFYLVYSNVKNFDGPWKDTPNYLVTTDDIFGEWSEPTYLSSCGFDGSLYHDDDGKKYFVSLRVDHRGGKLFGGIVLQEYDHQKKCLIGEMYDIYAGSDIGLTEGPHIIKKDDYYYLITAEGGTEYNHAVSIARSKDILGPYETAPNNPVFTSKHSPTNTLQKAGHGDFVQTKEGDWYAVFLTARPLTERGRCTLGRETSIEKIVWEKGEWPRSFSGGKAPRTEVEGIGLHFPIEDESSHFDFSSNALSPHFASLREPFSDQWMNIENGQLQLLGRASLSSFHEQSMLAHRVQSHYVEVVTKVLFSPDNFQQMSGLVCYYNTTHFHYLYISTDDEGKTKTLKIISADTFKVEEVKVEEFVFNKDQELYLKVIFDRAAIQYSFSLDGEQFVDIGPSLDGSILSDDYIQDDGTGRYRPAFTGAFIGMTCQDLSGGKHPAYFDFFDYKETVDVLEKVEGADA
ncbi:glycoside hydrolase family 43 protein [Flammeovirga sp. MY04]|uniref:glycoside hydrolase family 43 protein n=1 Tax=Flammeovirga sp. MY04 TaxID=1191459 RepID=UPI0008060E10|nr:glycoside hydrolase family 43 protein [Flammeovirga sp. MY04]ANQ50869.1 glycoside hydrolase family 43 protein [Flammeovirga sp. MY04]